MTTAVLAKCFGDALSHLPGQIARRVRSEA
jgi:hypothetical protein